jgi:hypothetical protein
VSVVLPGSDRIGTARVNTTAAFVRPDAVREVLDRHRALRRNAELLASERAELRVGLDPLDIVTRELRRALRGLREVAQSTDSGHVRMCLAPPPPRRAGRGATARASGGGQAGEPFLLRREDVVEHVLDLRGRKGHR